MRAARAALSSGWLPAAVVYLVTVRLLDTAALVSVTDTLKYTIGFVWLHVVPGTVVWRLVDWRRPDEQGRGRPFLEDAVLGSMTGIIAATPIYLALVAVGVPRLVVLWPLLVLVPAVASRHGRSLLRTRPSPTPAWWSWSLALVVLFVVVASADRNWAPHAFSPGSLSSPHIDEPYHLSLVGEFRHHFPAQVPYVAGTPLQYHWLVYPVMALQTWATGIDPVIVLRMLAPTVLSVVAVLGVGVAASRLSGHRWAGIAAPVILALLTPLDVMGWSGPGSPWVPQRWTAFLSSTQALATALAPLLVVMVVGMARGAARRPWHWAFTAVVMLACAGAKSPMLPLFAGGLCGTTLVMLVLRRRALGRTAALAALSVVMFVVAMWVFYGPGGRGLSFSPLSLIDSYTQANGIGPPEGSAVAPVRLTVALAMTVAILAPLSGGLGLFVRGGWRRPTPWILFGTSLVGVVAILVFGRSGDSQAYFLFCAAVPMAIFASMGLARLGGPLDRRTALVAVAAGVLGLLSAYAIASLTTSTLPDTADDTSGVLSAYLLPLVLAAIFVVAVVVLVGLATRQWDWLRGRRLLLSLFVVAGMCAPMAVDTAVGGDVNTRALATQPNGVIGRGGVKAATWLKKHSTPDQLVATNTHLWGAAWRNFWISAHSERRVLVEGWAYISRATVGLPSTEANNAAGGPPVFWDQAKLRLNDEVFTHPTRANVRELQRKYGVDWLFADRAERPDLEGLSRVAKLEKRSRRYLVYRLPDESH